MVERRRRPDHSFDELRPEHVIDMLKQLLTKFREERTGAAQEEQDSIQSHEMLMADMTQRIESKENRLKVVKCFHKRASNLKSVALTSLVVGVTEDPFVKVKDMTSPRDSRAIARGAVRMATWLEIAG